MSGAEIGGLRDFQVNILTDLSALRTYVSVERRSQSRSETPSPQAPPDRGRAGLFSEHTRLEFHSRRSVQHSGSEFRNPFENRGKNHKVDSVPQQDHQEILQVSGTVRIESFGTGRSPASTCFRSEGFDGQRHHRKIRSVRYSDRGGRRTQNQHRQPESQSQMGLLVRGNRYTKLKTKNNLRFLFCLKFIILDPMSQHLCFKLFDRDNVNEDDFLGRFVRSLCNFLNCFFFSLQW
jgi:hypothetical protein